MMDRKDRSRGIRFARRESRGRRSGIMLAVAAVLAAASFAASLSACSPAAPKGRVPADWNSWRKPVDKVLNYTIPGHGDKARVIYVNPAGWDYAGKAAAGRFEFPVGTVVVKEIYASGSPAPGEKPTTLDVMIKAPDDPDARGGWVWVVKDLASGKETVMTTTFCQSCHGNANTAHPYGDRNPQGLFRDFLFFPPMPGT